MSFKCRVRSAEFGVLMILMPLAAIAGAGESETKLVPPHGEIGPSFWELHAWQVILGAVAAVVICLLVLVWIWRPRPIVIIPPGSQARLDLEALRSHPENGTLLVRASGIIRRHATLALSLPPGEMTTAEFAKCLKSSSKSPPELSSSIIQFLRECDERKFSATPPPPQSSIVDMALELLDQIEKAASLTVPDAVVANPS